MALIELERNSIGEKGVAAIRICRAADELLTQLEFAVKLLTPIFGGTAQVERMRKALAKAKGLP